MKRSLLFLFTVIFVFSCAASSFGQARRTGRTPVDFARYQSIEGFTDGDGAYLRWQMEVERGNLGFLVYRVGDGGLELVSNALVQGSITGTVLKPYYGGTYDFYDIHGSLDTAYVLVSRAVDGRRIQTAPFTARYTNDFLGDTGYTKESLIERSQYQGGQVDKNAPFLTRELTALVNSLRRAPDPIAQRALVSQPGVKIAVKQDGMYRVTRAELQAAGFPVESDPANWRLFMNGNEQAIIVGEGGAYIDFYGRTIDTFEADTQWYYLISDTVAGRRVISRGLRSIGGNVVSRNYRFNTEKKQRVSYDPHVQNGDLDNYFGNVAISDPPIHETFTLSGIDPAGPDAFVQINFQGFTPSVHNIHVVINGTDAGVMSGPAGRVHFSGTFVVPQALLIEGINTVDLNTVASNDACYFDSIKVNFSRKYAADQGRVTFVTPGYRVAHLGGFTTPNFRVFDITADGEPQLIVGLPTEQDNGTFGVRMPSNRPAVFYAVEDSGLLQSPSIVFDDPSTLSSPDNSANYIIISYSDPDFLTVSESWADYRRSRNGGEFNVKVVNITDVYDEFSYGTHTAQAIKDFLFYARTNWQNPTPAYVLLVGDASYDRRNYTGFGNWDLVPSKNVSLIYEETGSDDALSDFDHNGVADMAIGRIPARSAAEISVPLTKTMLFETPANQMLDRGALFAYDNNIGYDFAAMSQILSGQLPSSMPRTLMNRDEPNAHQNLINAINQGKFLVNYAGHGSAGIWATPAFFTVADVQLLSNANSPSLFNMLTCFNGFFLHPQNVSLGEALLRASNGGAAATWASTTETTPDYQLTMGVRYYADITAGNISREGDLIKDAKTPIAGSDVGYSWALLGDPALKVR